jgi:hypothetical protein
MDTQLRTSVPATTRLQVVWVALLTLTACSTLLGLLTTPFDAEEGEFFHSLRNGEIASVALGHSQDFYADAGLNASSYNAWDDVAVVWVNRFGFRREAILNGLGALDQLTQDAQTSQGTGDPQSPDQQLTQDPQNPDPQNPDPQNPDAQNPDGQSVQDPQSTSRLDAAASIARTARSLGVAAPKVVQPGELPFDHVKWLSVLLIVLMIGFMLHGPQPRRTTKAGAFWAYMLPLNVGIFYALLRDSPWNQKMNLLPEPAARERDIVDPVTNRTLHRYGGWMVFIWFTLAARLALSLLLIAVAFAFPTHLDPVAWTAVDLAGNPLTLP